MSVHFTPLPLRAESDFFSQAQRQSHSLFTCWYIFEGDQSQATVVVGKKVSPKAVDRHRLKRQVREILRAIIAPAGLKAVFVLKHTALGVETRDLQAAIEQTISTLSHETPHSTRH